MHDSLALLSYPSRMCNFIVFLNLRNKACLTCDFTWCICHESKLKQNYILRLPSFVLSGFLFVFVFFYQQAAKTQIYIPCFVLSPYRNGSIVANTVLQFADSSSVPNTSDVTNTLVVAASNPNFTLPVNTRSIVATSKVFSF